MIAVGAATCLLLLIFGTGGASASAITTDHAVSVVELADQDAATIDTVTNTFNDTHSDSRAAWEMQSAAMTPLTRNSIDQTQWHVTSRLIDGNVLTVAAVQQRSEWSTTWVDESGATLANEHGTIATTNTVPAAGDFLRATRIDPQQGRALMPRSVVSDFVTATGCADKILLE